MIIAVEGINGTGKSTIVEGLVDKLKSKGIKANLAKLPGDSISPVCMGIRKLLSLDSPISPEAKFLLYLADMVEFYKSIDHDEIWILDRSAVSTVVYQSLDGVPMSYIETVLNYHNIYLSKILLLECDVSVAMERVQARKNKTIGNPGGFVHKDVGFYTKLKKRYREVVTESVPLKDHSILDTTNKNPEEILNEAYIIVKGWLKRG